MFQLKTNNNTINLKWGTWAMKEFTKVNNISVEQYFNLLATAHTNLDVIVQLVYIGYKSACVSTKQDIEYTEVDACDWIDEVGSIFQAEGQLVDYMKYIVDVTMNSVQGVSKEEEKKKPKKANLG
jgi:hypothetical protein